MCCNFPSMHFQGNAKTCVLFAHLQAEVHGQHAPDANTSFPNAKSKATLIITLIDFIFELQKLQEQQTARRNKYDLHKRNRVSN